MGRTKLINFKGVKRNKSGESHGENLVWIRSIVSLKIQGMCWQGRIHLETLEVCLRDFHEELC